MITILILLFIAGSILAVIKIMMQILAERKCVSDFEMRQFYNQQLKRNDAAYRRFIAHLGICEKCQNRLHTFQEPDDKDDLDITDHLVSKNK